MSITPKPIYLKDYSPADFLIDQIELTFDLYPIATQVESVLQIRPNPASKTIKPLLILQGSKDLILRHIHLNDDILPATAYTQTASSLTLHTPPDTAFSLKITTVISPIENTALEGLYLSNGIYCTQCEAEGFRRITYYLDRPDVMAKFTTTIQADSASLPVLLANGNAVAKGQLDDGRHWVRWEDPFPKPCYLFALVAGELSCLQDTFTSMSGREITLQIYMQEHNRSQCDYAMTALKQAMAWDEQTYGLEYDLQQYMIVAVDDFNMGAMENKGLNVFNTACVLAHPETATDNDYVSVLGVIAHEYFHNWTGNRVTCRDWFQLSLKEGLTVFRDQQFTAEQLAGVIKRIDDVKLLQTRQFAEDAGPMAHPVQPASYIEINNFYTVTIYEKGAELVRMLHTLLGAAGFRRGMDQYFAQHDGQAVTIEDFLNAMATANQIDLSAFLLWYQQAGTPQVTAKSRYNSKQKQWTLELTQHNPNNEAAKPVPIPLRLGAIDVNGQKLALQTADNNQLLQQNADEIVVLFTQTKQEIVFTGVKAKPIPSLFRHFSAPVKWSYDYSDVELQLLMQHDQDPFNRWQASQQYAARLLQQLIQQYQQQQSCELATDLLDVYQQLLTEPAADRALLAAMLTMPGIEWLLEQMPVMDIQAAHCAREYLFAALAKKLQALLLEQYQQLSASDDDYQITAEQIAQRRLRQVCLHYLLQADQQQYLPLALKQYQSATNMTDRLAALQLLFGYDTEYAAPQLAEFYQRYEAYPLVLDKWFRIQATAKSITLPAIQQLLAHPAFNLRNPNKVRALLGGFAMANPVAFHQTDGATYQFLAAMILRLDKLNPQIAARLSTAFSQWARWSQPYSEQMQAALLHLQQADLSADVYEIVSRSLMQ